jgi:hypothetical protein
MGVSYQMLGGPFLAVPTFVIRPRSLRKVALLGIRGLCKAALGIRGRLLRCVLHGGAVLVFGFALAAFGVLPRLEYNALSNLAGGYPTEVRGRGGWSSMDYWTLLLEPGVWYAGVGVLVLAVVAPLVARKRFAVPYFAALSLCALVLSGQGPTLLHSALYYLLPLFERLHPHDPDRILMLFYLGAALLAGAALSGLKERARENPSLLVPRLPAGRNLAFALLALVVFADLFVADRATMAEQDFSGPGWAVKTRKVDLAEYYSPSGAARFLQSKSEEEEPFRYFGYDPELEERWHISSPMLFAEPRTRALEANARSMVMGLQNVQGYNPTHIARYDQFMEALNGDAQDYHFMDIFEKGLDSPLLNLLNVRYIIVPAHNSQENQRRGLQHSLQPFERFEGEHPTVYEDDQSKVLENPKALPRAWIVHSARQVASAKEALKLLSSEQVDPKQIALLEEQPPEGISQPAEDPSAEQATLEDYEANRIKLKTSTGTAGLVVLSEVYYPAWKAYVDGKPAPIYVTDGLLRSVMVPAGEHEVELRYESWTLRVGILISVAAYAALVALAVGAGVQYWRENVRSSS